MLPAFPRGGADFRPEKLREMKEHKQKGMQKSENKKRPSKGRLSSGAGNET